MIRCAGSGGESEPEQVPSMMSCVVGFHRNVIRNERGTSVEDAPLRQ